MFWIEVWAVIKVVGFAVSCLIFLAAAIWLIIDAIKEAKTCRHRDTFTNWKNGERTEKCIQCGKEW